MKGGDTYTCDAESAREIIDRFHARGIDQRGGLGRKLAPETKAVSAHREHPRLGVFLVERAGQREAGCGGEVVGERYLVAWARRIHYCGVPPRNPLSAG